MERKRHRTLFRKIETRLRSAPPLASFPHAVDMYLSGGHGSHYNTKAVNTT